MIEWLKKVSLFDNLNDEQLHAYSKDRASKNNCTRNNSVP